MNLSSELISQFVKATKDETKTSGEGAMYGVVKYIDGKAYVQVAGSELYTPVTTTAAMNDGERVTVSIKNHTATVTGNVTDPSASSNTVTELGNNIVEVNTLVAKKVDTEALEAELATIDELMAEKATIAQLNATNAEIENIKTDYATVEVLESNYATIENLDATNAKVYNLDATYAKITQATINDLSAVKADVEELNTEKLSAKDAEIKYATIDKLNAANASITQLNSDVAAIDTLIFDSATGTTIQTSFANAVIAQLGDAQIKSAMIFEVDASKVNAGTIDTNKVTISSEDGRMVLSDETIQISDENRVRVQIGKDASGDYSINIWDGSGNLMFSEGGITDAAIKEAIIRNDMVSDEANISASKLDISSLFTVINEADSSETIKANRIYLDGESQTLDVSFKTMTETVNGLSGTVNSQGTDITTIQGQITSKVWEEDIKTAINNSETATNAKIQSLETSYSDLTQTVDGFKTEVAGTYATQTSVSDLNTYVTENYYTVTQTDAAIATTKNSITQTVSATYTTKTEFASMEIGARNLIRKSTGLLFEDYYFSGTFIPVYTEDSSDLEITCGVSAFSDDGGNVTLRGSVTATDDGAGNITIT